MSSVATSSLSDTLPSTVPKLDAEGDNWAIFFVHFMDSVDESADHLRRETTPNNHMLCHTKLTSNPTDLRLSTNSNRSATQDATMNLNEST